MRDSLALLNDILLCYLLGQCEYPALVTLDDVVARRNRQRSNSASRDALPLIQAIQAESIPPQFTGGEPSGFQIGLNVIQPSNLSEEPITVSML
jgi:hypothetical protein